MYCGYISMVLIWHGVPHAHIPSEAARYTFRPTCAIGPGIIHVPEAAGREADAVVACWCLNHSFSLQIIGYNLQWLIGSGTVTGLVLCNLWDSYVCLALNLHLFCLYEAFGKLFSYSFTILILQIVLNVSTSLILILP